MAGRDDRKWREEHDPRVVLADFGRDLSVRDGYPFAEGRLAEPDDPPLIGEVVVVRDTAVAGVRRGWLTALEAGEGFVVIRLVGGFGRGVVGRVGMLWRC